MNRFQNQKLSIMGDSISTYEGYLPEGYPAFYSYHDAPLTDIQGYRDTWWGQVIERMGFSLLVNNSWSGSYVCQNPAFEVESYGSGDARCAGLGADGQTPDQIIVYLGSNDRGAGYPLTSMDKNDLTVIENAYGAMLDKLQKNYPKAELWCCTFPITTCSRNPQFSFPQMQNGIPMERYGEVIRAVAERHHCHVIDLWDPTQLCDTLEGLHPNYNGMRMIADKVVDAMSKDAQIDLRENIIILSAPSATGKNTVYDRVKERLPHITRIITATTRDMADTDVDGVDYYFISKDEFMSKVEAGFFAEYVLNDACYGTPLKEVTKCSEDTPLFLIIDTDGMKRIMKKYPNSKSIFLMPPSMEALKARLYGRGRDNEEEMIRRFNNAEREIADSVLYDHIVVNDDLEECVRRIVEIVESYFPSKKA